MTTETRSRAGQIELATGLFVLTALVGIGLALAVRRNAPVESRLVVEGLEFGSVWEQPAYRHALALTNVTNRPVHVVEIATGCGCTQIVPQGFVIPPGERQELMATLDLTGRAGEPFEIELRPNLAHQPPGSRSVWTLRGEVLPNPIRCSQPSIEFPDVIRGELPPVGEIEVSLADRAPFDNLRATVDDAAAFVQTERLSPRQWQVVVTLPEELPVGPFEFLVRIEAASTTFSTADPAPFRDVRVTGVVREDVAAWPASLNFGMIEQGRSGKEYVVLASHRGQPFEVLQIDAPEDVAVEMAPRQLDDGSKTFVVEQQATERGDRRSEVVFHVRQLDARTGEVAEIAIPLKATYYGMAAGP